MNRLAPSLAAALLLVATCAAAHYPAKPIEIIVPLMHDLAREMHAEGPEGGTRFMEGFRQHPLADLHTFAGFDRVRDWERQYLGEEAMKKYADSVGHVPT